MSKALLSFWSIVAILFGVAVRAYEAPQAPQTAATNLTGRWTVSADFFGSPLLFSLELKQDGEKLTGEFDGDKLEGTQKGEAVHFLAKDEHGGREEAKGTLRDDMLAGTLTFVNGDDPSRPETHNFTAKRVPPRPQEAPQRREFVPTTFYRQFSAATAPVLTVNPGDMIHTTTVDAGGTDEKGVTRVLGGNPETGPFYVESTAPGDTLVVHITQLKLNRDWAESDDYLVDRATDRDLAVKMKDGGKSVRWHLDLERGLATPEKPGEHLTRYTVPVKPMLGCVGVAQNPAGAAPGSGDSGRFGGNMDFNEIVDGATVYLPVNVPGALLYVGDGHAAQGDGELNGNALETSMDVEFTVDLIRGKSTQGPRFENDEYLMASGIGGSLQDALQMATTELARWLERDYKLSPNESNVILGTSIRYEIAEVVDPQVHIVAKVSKAVLEPLR